MFEQILNNIADEKQDKNIGVLFSGGLDSTTVTGLLLSRDCIVTLITVDNGALSNIKIAREQAKNLACLGRGKIKEHVFLDSSFLFREIAIRSLVGDILKYKKDYVCVGCKLSMLCVAIAYAKNNGINVLVDGSTKSQDFYPEQTKSYVQATHKLCKENDITLLRPLYELNSKDEIKKLALLLGLYPRSVDAVCLFEERQVESKEDEIENYIENRIQCIKEYINFLCKVERANEKPPPVIDRTL